MERLLYFMNHNKSALILTASTVTAAVAGTGIGYVLAARKARMEAEKEFEERLAAEEEFIRQHYAKLYKRAEFDTPEKARKSYSREELKSIVESLGYVPGDTNEDSEGEAIDKIAEEIDADVYTGEEPREPKHVVAKTDYETEDPTRRFIAMEESERRMMNPNKPYVLAEEEYFENDPAHIQMSLTYFEVDDILVGEADEVIDDHSIVGEENLERFGHGTKSKDVVYVRNEKLKADYEVCRSEGSYAKEVLGFIEHSESRGKVRKFRSDYE